MLTQTIWEHDVNTIELNSITFLLILTLSPSEQTCDIVTVLSLILDNV